MRYFLLSISFILSFFAQAQRHAPVDSLLKAADIEKNDSSRMMIYQQLGDYYLDNNASKAIEFFEKVNGIAKELNIPLRIGNSYYDLGFSNLLKADYEKSLYNYQQSALVYDKMKDSGRLANTYMSIGNLYFENKNFGKVEEYYSKAEKLILHLKDSMRLNSLYDSRGVHYDQAGKYDSAALFLERAYNIAKLIHAEDYAMLSLSNLSLTYKHQNKTDEALRGFDSVRVYYERTDAPKDYMAAIYNNIAATYVQAGKIPQALIAFNKSIEFSKNAGTPMIEMENYRNLSDMYGGQRDFEKQSIFLKKYYTIKDSVFNADNKNKLTELEATYQVDKKNIELVKKDAELVKQRSQRNIFIIIAISILGLLAILGFFYGRIRNKNSLLQKQNIQISEQKNELQTLNQVKDRLFSIISHDLRNPLVTLKSYLSLADNENIAAEKKQLFKMQTANAVAQTSDMLDNLLAWANVQIKNTRATIIPVNIQDLVTDTVSNVQAQAQQKQLNIIQNIDVPVLAGDYDILAIALRNILTNAVKYSPDNKSIFITSSKEDNQILLSIKDEGVGMTREQIDAILSNQNETTKGTKGEKGSGLGLFLVRELLQKINATLVIKSEPGNGSEFIIQLPE